MSIGPFQIAVVLLLVLVLFGRGRISEFMGDFGKGVRSFRKGLSEEDMSAPASPRLEAAVAEAEAARAPSETKAG